jgi:hypothetical protein
MRGQVTRSRTNPPPSPLSQGGPSVVALVLPPPLGGFQLSTAGLADLSRITITPPEDNEIWAFDI